MEIEALVDRLAPGARITRHWPLTGGVSADVQAVEFRQPDGTDERVVVRRHRDLAGKPHRADRADREHRLLTVLHARGLPVPRPRLFVPPATLVIDFVVGDTTLPADPAAPLAEMLTTIHAVDLADLHDLPVWNDPLPDLRAWLPTLTGLDRAAARCGPLLTPPRLLHGDYWPGNVMWREGCLAAVLDWEDAAVGDPLSDLACARVELACAVDEALAERVTTLYLAASGADRARLPLWDLFVATASLQYMEHWGLTPAALATRRARTLACQDRARRSLGLG